MRHYKKKVLKALMGMAMGICLLATVCMTGNAEDIGTDETVMPQSIDTTKTVTLSISSGTAEYVVEEEKEVLNAGTGSSGEMGTMGGETTTEIVETTIMETHCYTVKTKDGVLYRFNDNGQLVAMMEPNFSFLLYSYSADGRLKSEQTKFGKKISLGYDKDSGVLKSILLPDGTTLKRSLYRLYL